MSEQETEVPLEEPATGEEPVEAPVEPGEGEQVEEEERDTPEEETHPDEQAIFSEKEAEKGRKRIERAVTGMVKTLNEVLADEAQYLEPCPRCKDDFPGLIWQPAIKQVLPETRAAVMISMGEDPDPILPQDPSANRCDRCDGWGKVATGSRVNRQEKLECEECSGRGWIGPRAARLAAKPVTVEAAVAYENGDERREVPDTDPWGRVRGEPLYGVMPGFEQ